MTPHDEHLLYLRDRWARAKEVAPRRAQMLAEASPAEKRRLWNAFGRESQHEIRKLKEADSQVKR